jgi:UDP-N-acetyl-D-glucosamine dehydrogenase
MDLRERIASKTAVVGVVGLGYVGLPLAMEFCRAGFRVIGFDIDRHKIESLGHGMSYVMDVAPETVREALAHGRFEPTTDFERLRELDAVSICVPTPLRKSREPDVSYIVAAVNDLVPRIHAPMLIILESTTYPGTTEELVQAEVEKRGFCAGRDVYICFSPERVDPGNSVFKTVNTPKVIGGITPACADMGALLYGQTMETIIKVGSARTAEMVKLLENTFRAVNIGLANEMALMCERMGMDIWQVISAAATKPFGFMPFYPGPGIGGHCIPLDPTYLSWKAKMYHFTSRFIELATDINGSMPYHVSKLAGEILNLEGKAVYGSDILCLGVAYKKDVNDTRESPSLDVIRLLLRQGARVRYSDPHVPDISASGIVAETVPLTRESVEAADCVLLLTNHSAFDYDFIARHLRVCLDTRAAFHSRGIEQHNIFRLGAPLPGPEEWRRRKTPFLERQP